MGSAGTTGRTGKKKIDVRLLDRRKVLQSLETVRGIEEMGSPNIEVWARRLAGMGAAAPPTLLQALETEQDRTVVGVAVRALECILEAETVDTDRYVASIKRLVMLEDVPDNTKLRLLVTLNQLGIDVGDMQFAAAFKDFAAIVKSSREEVLSQIQSDESLLAQLLEEMGQLPCETRISMVEDYAQSGQPMVFRLYRILGRTDDARMGRCVVESLAVSASVQAADTLAGLAEDALCAETRERAARALRAMKFAGIRPRSKKPAPLGEIYNCLASAVDGVGSRMVWIARYRGKTGRLSVIHLMLNDHYGVRDCFGSSRMSRQEYDARVQSLDEPGSISYAWMDYDHCVDLVRDALASNFRLRTPVAPQFLLFMEILGDRSLDPEPYVPRFAGIEMSAIKEDAALLHLSSEALDLPAMQTWFILSDAIYPIAHRAIRLLEPGHSRLAFHGDAMDQLAAMERQIVRKCISQDVMSIRTRLELMADYCLRTGCCEHEKALSLLAAAQNLPSDISAFQRWGEGSESLLPLDEHPFLLAMARKSLEHACAMLRIAQCSQSDVP